jgi:hypothetical protein
MSVCLYLSYLFGLWPVWLYHIISHTVRFSGRGGGLLNIKSFLISSKDFSETLLILRRIQQYIIISVHKPSCNVPLILVRF